MRILIACLFLASLSACASSEDYRPNPAFVKRDSTPRHIYLQFMKAPGLKEKDDKKSSS